MVKHDINIKNEKKLRILAAAGKMFAEKGYHKTTIEDIAKAAGIGKSTFYEYYESKEEILKFIVDLASEYFLGVMLNQTRNCSSAKEKIKHIVYCSLLISGLHSDTMNLFCSLLMDNALRDFSEYFRDKFWNVFERLVSNIFIDAMNSGDIEEDDADALVYMFLGMVVGSMHNMCDKCCFDKPKNFMMQEINIEDLISSPENLPQHRMFLDNAEKITDMLWNGIAKR
ncbi:MAG: TetR/AcrR family transcriptional regulator [Bacillota bacterium]|jgi:AcrR family transcriptional regulator